jgi:hypothetical protein
VRLGWRGLTPTETYCDGLRACDGDGGAAAEGALGDANPSTAVRSGVQPVTDGGSAELGFEFDRDGAIFRSGVILRTSVLGDGVRKAIAPRGTTEDACDTVVEIEDSPWVSELDAAKSTRSRT